ELPGMEAAGLAARQQWWLLTAAATAGGLGLIIFAKPAALRVLDVALIVVPHLIGAPAAPHASSGVPAELAAEFATASLAVAAANHVHGGDPGDHDRGPLHTDRAAQETHRRRRTGNPVKTVKYAEQ